MPYKNKYGIPKIRSLRSAPAKSQQTSALHDGVYHTPSGTAFQNSTAPQPRESDNIHRNETSSERSHRDAFHRPTFWARTLFHRSVGRYRACKIGPRGRDSTPTVAYGMLAGLSKHASNVRQESQDVVIQPPRPSSIAGTILARERELIDIGH